MQVSEYIIHLSLRPRWIISFSICIIISSHHNQPHSISIMSIDLLLLAYRKTRTVQTLDDLLGTRQEGYICELRCPPQHKSVNGRIRLELIQEELFFHESLSGIQKKEIGNYRLEAKVQFSVNKNDRGFFAEDLYITEVWEKPFWIYFSTDCFSLLLVPIEAPAPYQRNS